MTGKVFCFNLEATQVFRIPRIKELTNEERASIWFSRKEFKSMRDEVDDTIKLLNSGLTDPERVGFCFRGLEERSPEMGERRRSSITNSINAVMKAQRLVAENNDKTSEDDDILIARHYEACTSKCAGAARRMAAWDAKCVNMLWKVDSTPRPPRRRTVSVARAG